MFYSMLASEAFEMDILRGMDLKSVVQTAQCKVLGSIYVASTVLLYSHDKNYSAGASTTSETFKKKLTAYSNLPL